jgi:LEA14-like dessication related protein
MKLRSLIVCLGLLVWLSGCLPKDAVELRGVEKFGISTGGSKTTLTGDAVFYNPNSSRMKLRQIKIDVFIDGEKTAMVDQDTKVVAKAKSEFTVPVSIDLADNVQISDLLLNVLGSKKKREVHYKGHLKVNLNGVPMRIPIDHKEEFKMSLKF